MHDAVRDDDDERGKGTYLMIYLRCHIQTSPATFDTLACIELPRFEMLTQLEVGKLAACKWPRLNLIVGCNVFIPAQKHLNVCIACLKKSATTITQSICVICVLRGAILLGRAISEWWHCGGGWSHTGDGELDCSWRWRGWRWWWWCWALIPLVGTICQRQTYLLMMLVLNLKLMLITMLVIPGARCVCVSVN